MCKKNCTRNWTEYVWDSLSELHSSLCERRLERAVLRPALLPVFPSDMTSHSKIARFNWECIAPFRDANKSKILRILRTSSPLLQTNFTTSARILCTNFHHHHHQWHDSPSWALAFLRSFAHSSPLRATFFQFLSPNILISWSAPSSHRNFGLPALLTPSGLVLN
jgi:hypothetical protein